MNVINLDARRPPSNHYVACMDCGNSWTEDSTPVATGLNCRFCGKAAGEVVRPHDLEWFRRFTEGGKTTAQRKRRNIVLLTAHHMYPRQ